MVDYFAGDTVVCKVGYGRVVPRDSKDFEHTKNFDIACVCDNGYLILLPQAMYLQNSFVLDKRSCAEFGLPEKFIDGTVLFINKKHIVSLHTKMTGLACAKCKEYYEYAAVNRIDANGNGILICWGCRNYPQYR